MGGSIMIRQVLDDAARWDSQQSDYAKLARLNRSPTGLDGPRPVATSDLTFHAPAGIELRGRRALVDAHARQPRRALATALGVLTGRRVFFTGRLWVELLERVGNISAAQDAWPGLVLRVLGENGILVIMPDQDGFLGRGRVLSLVVAMRAGREVLLADPAGRLVVPEGAGLRLVEGRAAGRVCRCTWLRAPVPALDQLAELSAPAPRPPTGATPPLPKVPPEVRSAAGLARSQEAKRRARELREEAGFGRNRPVDEETRKRIESAVAEVIARPLEDFMENPPPPQLQGSDGMARS